jgi:hypothetical protein
LVGARLARLHWASRHGFVALAALVSCGAGLGAALHGHWDTYGALQLPLLFETAAAAVISVTTSSPFGEPERATGRRLPCLRIGLALVLSTAAVALLAAGAATAHLAGGTFDLLRNTAGTTGIALLFAVGLGGGLSWAGPAGYMMVGFYALYKDWHGPALTTPWIWPARPPDDLGAALCAGLVFAAGMVAFALRGAHDRVGEQGD